MATKYRARLQGDLLEWLGEKPATPESETVEVDITISRLRDEENGTAGSRMAAALEKLAGLVVGTSSEDAAAWERELRSDRELPGRGTC